VFEFRRGHIPRHAPLGHMKDALLAAGPAHSSHGSLMGGTTGALIIVAALCLLGLLIAKKPVGAILAVVIGGGAGVFAAHLTGGWPL
jgi:hypothetical protein